jgi:small subunit ribosomal protein S4
LAPSRKAARISIGHNHFCVNGLRVNKPGYLVKVGDAIGVRNREPTKKLVRAAVELDPNRSLQSWLKLDATRLEGSVVALPTRDDVQIPVEEQLVVEFYSR